MTEIQSVGAPLPCRPEANVANFSAGKQRGSMMIHRSGNLFMRTQYRQQAMCLNSRVSSRTLGTENRKIRGPKAKHRRSEVELGPTAQAFGMIITRPSRSDEAPRHGAPRNSMRRQ